MKLLIKHFRAYFRTGSFTSSARFVNNALLSPKESSERGHQQKAYTAGAVFLSTCHPSFPWRMNPFSVNASQLGYMSHQVDSAGSPEAKSCRASLVLFLEDFLTLCA